MEALKIQATDETPSNWFRCWKACIWIFRQIAAQDVTIFYGSVLAWLNRWHWLKIIHIIKRKMNEVLKNKIHVLSQLANVDKDFDIRELSFIYDVCLRHNITLWLNRWDHCRAISYYNPRKFTRARQDRLYGWHPFVNTDRRKSIANENRLTQHFSIVTKGQGRCKQGVLEKKKWSNWQKSTPHKTKNFR